MRYVILCWLFLLGYSAVAPAEPGCYNASALPALSSLFINVTEAFGPLNTCTTAGPSYVNQSIDLYGIYGGPVTSDANATLTLNGWFETGVLATLIARPEKITQMLMDLGNTVQVTFQTSTNKTVTYVVPKRKLTPNSDTAWYAAILDAWLELTNDEPSYLSYNTEELARRWLNTVQGDSGSANEAPCSQALAVPGTNASIPFVAMLYSNDNGILVAPFYYSLPNTSCTALNGSANFLTTSVWSCITLGPDIWGEVCQSVYISGA